MAAAQWEYLLVPKGALQQTGGHGGLQGYLSVSFTANDVRVGTLVGEDKYGNRYYEANKQFLGLTDVSEMNGRNAFWDVDGSIKGMVPLGQPYIQHEWPSRHYVPYSTTRKKIQEWVPSSTPYK
ncbi:NADH dehydrogenase [ubiquinone] 1 alpha subcomplex subunit 12-like [Echinops telfairi]|uniref:NADH dehydrogenase [ubiquinone] 1 alpha subcomplex subunit 12-like n=1 Tax=Echinops telfairi TaxID=9371 RepID=A0AC55D158_ECHTE|nr:NADH dehydrogenase [ubiquinone] 1 alpha subcomplex subunit 12-like [Echinops telfairi]